MSGGKSDGRSETTELRECSRADPSSRPRVYSEDFTGTQNLRFFDFSHVYTISGAFAKHWRSIRCTHPSAVALIAVSEYDVPVAIGR
jgi:hypothetical protein